MQEAAHPPARVPSRAEARVLPWMFAWGGLDQVRQWRRKRVLMRPEAAFPYVFAAEGAQHPPLKPPRSTSRHAHRPATTTAAGGTILLCRNEY